jgi:aspartyl-tRNA(Asn)/glutamyl-tRNA(Gln) amidotransferase subunit A
MSRTVADGALMLSVIAGPDDRDRNTLPPSDFGRMETLKGDLTGLRAAYSADWGYAAVDPRVRDVVGRAVEVFAYPGPRTSAERRPGDLNGQRSLSIFRGACCTSSSCRTDPMALP